MATDVTEPTKNITTKKIDSNSNPFNDYFCRLVANSNKKFFLLTIDVEDWFQVENFKPWISFDSWSSREIRVERNTHRILDSLDSTQLKNSKRKTKNYPKATFFILGWIAQRLPRLIREIHARGHEVASHGYNHDLCTDIPAADLTRDLTNSKKFLEDLIGAGVTGYRAPSFSINDTVLKIIQNCGYLYDSSYNSFDLNPRYGKISPAKLQRRGIAYQLSRNFHELPISNLVFKNIILKKRFRKLELPWGGGGYFRFIPFPIFKRGIKTIFQKQSAYLFYMHPWEIDPHQPRVKNISLQYRLRHYTGLEKTASKLARLIRAFPENRFISCARYLEEQVHYSPMQN